jgi:hypothetical protein
MMQHIYPLNDLREHELDGTSCPCGVEVDWENGLVIHAAFDHREIVEQAERLINATETH